ncbi:MAG TPA: hypothetical protein VLT32_19100 [Candidatus Sulfomarinibacteraceae bacterium]|nr:hypothetical protein [Candidatus Sulfomarinibacteraceae bacterium]
MTMRILAPVLVALAVAAAGAVPAGAEDERPFSLDLDRMTFRPTDQRTEARLARWNDDPMARVAMHMASEQARILGGGQPGAGQPRSLVFSVKLQRGLAAALTVASSASGVEFYERRLAVIRWPWQDEDEAPPAMPLDEQLSILLGDRLESGRR